MCFKLIQDTITEKIHFVSNFLGITSDESEVIDENINKTSANNQADIPEDHQKTNDIDIEHYMIGANDNLMFVKPSSNISISSIVESADNEIIEAPIPVIPGPTMTTETKNEIIKLTHDSHPSSGKSINEVRIKNKVKPVEYE
jgi:hypothetical protein